MLPTSRATFNQRPRSAARGSTYGREQSCFSSNKSNAARLMAKVGIDPSIRGLWAACESTSTTLQASREFGGVILPTTRSSHKKTHYGRQIRQRMNLSNPSQPNPTLKNDKQRRLQNDRDLHEPAVHRPGWASICSGRTNTTHTQKFFLTNKAPIPKRSSGATPNSYRATCPPRGT